MENHVQHAEMRCSHNLCIFECCEHKTWEYRWRYGKRFGIFILKLLLRNLRKLGSKLPCNCHTTLESCAKMLQI